MPDKPTGRIGPFRVSGGPDGPTGDWSRIRFPKQKEDIEEFVLTLFLTEMRKTGATILSFKRNQEDDFDYTLSLPGGLVSLDLTEIIYRDGQGRPYEGDNMRIESYRYAEQICDAIMAKSAHYGRAGAQPIHLLTYITHWRFHAHEVVIRLVQHMLQRSPPVMENVFFLSPLDETNGNLRVLYPSNNPLDGRDADIFRDDWYLTLNPANWQVVTNTKESESAMPRANPPTRIEDVVRVPHCWVEEDGRHVIIESELTGGTTAGLRLPYDQLDFIVQALLQCSLGAYQRQVELGTKPFQENFVTDPMTIESYRLMRSSDGSHLLIQCAGRQSTGPLGMGSFRINETLARKLGKQLLESADLMARETALP